MPSFSKHRSYTPLVTAEASRRRTAPSTSSFLCIGSRIQKENGIEYDIDEQYLYQMNFTHWATNGPLVRNILENSATVVDHLEKIWNDAGVEGIIAVNQGRPCVRQKMGNNKIEVLFDTYVTPNGGTLLLETTATELITDENGAVCGVKAVKQDGTNVIVNAKGVLLNTGGFAGNKTMLKEQFGTSEYYLQGTSRNTGDGINMAQKVGSLFDSDAFLEYAEYCGNDAVDFYPSSLRYITQPGFLTVNARGERFVNEQMCMSSILENAGPSMNSVGSTYVIFTQSDMEKLEAGGICGLLSPEDLDRLVLNPAQKAAVNLAEYPALAEQVEKCIVAGQAWRADTLEELGSLVGFEEDMYSTTIKDYLGDIAAGVDSHQGKDPAMLHPLTDGPFYCVRIVPALFCTLGGIKVTSDCQVINQNREAIQGLYAGGSDAAGYFVSPYYSDAAGHTCGFTWISGYLAAKHFLANN